MFQRMASKRSTLWGRRETSSKNLAQQTQLSEYEKIRENNIKEIQQAMEATLGDISCLKKDILSPNDNNHSESETDIKHRKTVKPKLVAVRRSLRVRNKVCYRELNEPHTPLKFRKTEKFNSLARQQKLHMDYEGMMRLEIRVQKILRQVNEVLVKFSLNNCRVKIRGIRLDCFHVTAIFS